MKTRLAPPYNKLEYYHKGIWYDTPSIAKGFRKSIHWIRSKFQDGLTIDDLEEELGPIFTADLLAQTKDMVHQSDRREHCLRPGGGCAQYKTCWLKYDATDYVHCTGYNHLERKDFVTSSGGIKPARAWNKCGLKEQG